MKCPHVLPSKGLAVFEDWDEESRDEALSSAMIRRRKEKKHSTVKQNVLQSKFQINSKSTDAVNSDSRKGNRPRGTEGQRRTAWSGEKLEKLQINRQENTKK